MAKIGPKLNKKWRFSSNDHASNEFAAFEVTNASY